MQLQNSRKHSEKLCGQYIPVAMLTNKRDKKYDTIAKLSNKFLVKNNEKHTKYNDITCDMHYYELACVFQSKSLSSKGSKDSFRLFPFKHIILSQLMENSCLCGQEKMILN